MLSGFTALCKHLNGYFLRKFGMQLMDKRRSRDQRHVNRLRLLAASNYVLVEYGNAQQTANEFTISLVELAWLTHACKYLCRHRCQLLNCCNCLSNSRLLNASTAVSAADVKTKLNRSRLVAEEFPILLRTN